MEIPTLLLAFAVSTHASVDDEARQDILVYQAVLHALQHLTAVQQIALLKARNRRQLLERICFTYLQHACAVIMLITVE